MSSAQNGNGATRWGAWASVAAVGLTFMGSVFFLYQQATSANNKASSLEARMAQVEMMTASNASDVKVICASLREVETQFRAADQVRSLTQAENARLTAMLWAKSFGASLPTDNAYYPMIAQERPTPCA